MRLAVIPARGGSKRIPRKNIKPFAGKPMIAWSIEGALKSGCFDRIIVSTDDAEIADFARSAGAETPFIRPSSLSDDNTGTVPVVAHAIEWAMESGMCVEEICCIYATAPFIRPRDIKQTLDLLVTHGSNYVFPIVSYPAPVQRAIKIDPDGRAAMFNPELYGTRSQDLEEAYYDAGQFYWGTREAWLKRQPMFSSGALPLVVPRYRVQDIDTEEDWRYAEIMFDLLSRLPPQDTD